MNLGTVHREVTGRAWPTAPRTPKNARLGGVRGFAPLVLALSLASPVRAQDVVDVELATVTQRDGGVLLLHGGAWLSDAKTLATARELAAARAAQPTPAQLALAMGLGVLLGAAAGVAVSRSTTR